MARRFRLNPCDYLFFAHHDMMRRRGQTGNLPFMVMDLRGELDVPRLEQAVTLTLDQHPVLRTRACVSLVTGRPAWAWRERLDRPAVRASDLRLRADWLAEADHLCQERFAEGWDVFACPQVRVEAYIGPGRTRLCLRWPHALMDAEGAQWFMHEVDRMAEGAAKPPAGLSEDGAPLDALAGESLWRRWRLFRKGLEAYHGVAGTASALADGNAAGGRWRFVHRSWDGEAFARLTRIVDRYCREGPARFSRYLGGCVLRALHRVYGERGMAGNAYLVTLPMRVRGLPARRPLHGNLLVSATLCGAAEALKDKQRLMDELGHQISTFQREGRARANWALVWMTGFCRLGQYRWLLAHPRRGLQPYASGFSYYGEIDPPIRRFLGLAVENFWGSGSMSAPPGWNPVFSRFGDTLNLGLSWLEGFFRRETVQRYVDAIESEMFDAA